MMVSQVLEVAYGVKRNLALSIVRLVAMIGRRARQRRLTLLIHRMRT